MLYANQARITSFTKDYKADSSAFVASEIIRVEKIMGEYQTVVFKAIPIIIILCSLLVLFVNKPIWRAIGATTIAMMVVIVLIDSNANERVVAYHEQLVFKASQLKN